MGLGSPLAAPIDVELPRPIGLVLVDTEVRLMAVPRHGSSTNQTPSPGHDPAAGCAGHPCPVSLRERIADIAQYQAVSFSPRHGKAPRQSGELPNAQSGIPYAYEPNSHEDELPSLLLQLQDMTWRLLRKSRFCSDMRGGWSVIGSKSASKRQLRLIGHPRSDGPYCSSTWPRCPCRTHAAPCAR